MASPLLGFLFANEKYPTVPPEFAVDVGWMCFWFVVLVLLFAWTKAESVRRALLALEDPRTYAVLRIGFALMTLVCFWNLYPYWRMLWSDEGIFDLAYAQDRMGRSALRGWSPEEGFFGAENADGLMEHLEQMRLWAVLNFLWNKPSLHYMYGSPTFVVGYMVVFFGVLLLYAAGVWSRVTGVLSWLMMSGLYNRNSLYWEGTDTVYRCFFFILLFAKTGHAWSFDNWLRCRRLRKKGLLAEPGAEDEEDGKPTRAKQPIYRLVPSWPRYLFMLQLSALYLTTGAVKTGHVWAQGDALYYALNMDHFWRFEYATQWVSSIFGMNLFRVNTWVTHWWERLFPLALIGAALKFGHQHEDAPWSKAQNVWWRRWLGRALFVAGYALLYRLIVITLPFCLAMHDDTPADPWPRLIYVHAAFGVIIPIAIVLWFLLKWKPIHLFKEGGKRLGTLRIPIPRREKKLEIPVKIPEIRIDNMSLRNWFLGRRVWLTLGFIFHGFLIGFMNIGMFPFIMLMTYAAWVKGEEFARIFRWVGEQLRKGKRTRKLVPENLERFLIPAERPEDAKIRGRKLPDAIVLVFGILGAALVWAKADAPRAPAADNEWITTAFYWWLGSIIAVSLAFRMWRPSAATLSREREAGPALAYSAVGRALALGATVYHAMAVGTSLFPAYSVFGKWRTPVRGLFGSWLRGTGTSQSWKMFAPNPPRANTFMKTVVVLENGDRWDLRSNGFHYWQESGPDSRPSPWIINDRMRKMQRRMVGKGKWYLRYWAEYHCREWALEHGETPLRIEIRKYWNSIPTPAFVYMFQPKRFRGRKNHATGAISGQPYNPRKLKTHEREVQKHNCRGAGELPLFMKERYGLPISEGDRERAERENDKYTRKFANRRDLWEKRRDWGRWFTEDPREKAKREREARAEERRARPIASKKPDVKLAPAPARPKDEEVIDGDGED
jgi:hypothetical protein